jgi:opacity protein-like surface antigen
MGKYLLVIGLLNCLSQVAHAQSFQVPSYNEGRGGKWDLTFQVTTNESKTYVGDQGSSFNLKGRTGFGLGAAYNFNEHLALGFDMNFTSPRYTAILQPQDPSEAAVFVDHRANIVTGQLKGTWNILKSSITPYIDAGAGFTFIDSNIVDSETPTFCWFDPWYGYVCNTSSYSDTNFSYGGAAGIRWDTSNNLVLKVSVNTLVVDLPTDPQINSVRFEIGARY